MTTSTNTLKSRITRLLPHNSSYKSVTVNQLMARLNSSRTATPVARSTVRGRLSELVSSGVAARETLSSGVGGFFLRD